MPVRLITRRPRICRRSAGAAACVAVAAAAAIAVPVPAAATPDGPGGRIAFVSYRAGNHEIYIVRPDATAPPQRITFNAGMDLHQKQ